MEEFGFTLGDFFVLCSLLLGSLMGLSLGLVKAVLFGASWVGAGIVTFYSYEQLKPYFGELFETQLYVDIGSVVSVFVVCLVLLFWLFSLVWRAVRRSEFSGLGRSLGFLGGLMVGVFLVCIAYLGAIWMWSEEDLPAAIAKARSRPYLEIGAHKISSFLPGPAGERAKSVVGDTSQRLKDAMETERAMRKLIENTPKIEDNPISKQKGYAVPFRRDLDRLIESKQK